MSADGDTHVRDALAALLAGSADLGYERSLLAFRGILTGCVDPAILAGFLTALQMRGETAAELLAAIEIIRQRQITLPNVRDAVDLGGSGGDDDKTFNVSTTAAIVATAAGATVYKHVNRAVSGPSGSVDVVEALQLPLARTAHVAMSSVARHGIAFLHSEAFLRYPDVVTATRRTLRICSAFNLAGPWCNAARVTRQVVGVPSPRYLDVCAVVAQALSPECALIVHGCHGDVDEFSPTGATLVAEVRGQRVRTYDVHPVDFGLPTGTIDTVAGGSPAENAARALEILRNEDRGPGRTVVIMTAGAALYAAGRAASFGEGVSLAKATVERGAAYERLLHLREYVAGAEEERPFA